MKLSELKYLSELYEERKEIQYMIKVLSLGYKFELVFGIDYDLRYDDKKMNWYEHTPFGGNKKDSLTLENMDMMELTSRYEKLLAYVDSKIDSFKLERADD